MTNVLIRPYQPCDRAAVRQICCDTADRGEPVENFFHDRELVADLVTRYYTDFEPQSSWVAEAGGRVVGYLTGCLDSRRQVRTMLWRIGPAAILHAILRGTLWRRETWRLLRAMVRTWRSGGTRRGGVVDSYLAHVHVNLVRDSRGQQTGRRLMEQFLSKAKSAGVTGVYASVRGDNESGCGFFERVGFTALARYPLVLTEGDSWRTTHTVVYGRKL